MDSFQVKEFANSRIMGKINQKGGKIVAPHFEIEGDERRNSYFRHKSVSPDSRIGTGSLVAAIQAHNFAKEMAEILGITFIEVEDDNPPCSSLPNKYTP